MFYVLIVDERAVSVTTEASVATRQPRRAGSRYEHRHHWKTFERAMEVAAQLTEATGTQYLATDASASTSPRYDVIAAPVLGTPVSKAFNGDSYPVGVITRISVSFRRIETSEGNVFFRRRESGVWLEGGTWALVNGHHDRRNPSF